ncbi:MAG: endonuclease domain-containing protein [Cytophagaceae bacterium]
MENLHKGANSRLFGYARENRQQQTEAEKLLWSFLRNRNLKGFKFRRQHPIDNFIADFYCHECNLVVEIDGKYHLASEQADYDKGRTYELENQELRVIRFCNDDVLKKLNYVLEEISKNLIPNPSPQGEGS